MTDAPRDVFDGGGIGGDARPSASRLVGPFLFALVLATVLGLYWPALDLPLMGDDYQWVQHTHRALHRPILLLSDLDTFLRPANTWALALDRLLWPSSAGGHHLTNLLLHAVAAWMLALVGRRLGLGGWLALGVGVLWVATPFTSEAAIQVAIRFENLLLVAWLALCLAWPGPGEEWSTRRRLAAGAALVLAAASKETWVVTPALALALELGWRRRPWRQAWLLPAWLGVLAVLYSGLYFIAFPSDKGYFRWNLSALAKLPHELAAFWGLERLQPAELPLTWRGVLALAVTLGLVAWSCRQGAAGWLGGALLLVPTIPTLLVPFLPLRYVAIPYAGFLLILAVATRRLWAILPSPLRLLGGPAAALAVVWAATGAVAVRLELADAAAVGRAHERLLAEATAIAPSLPAGTPWALVRAEREQPLAALADSVQGLPKTYYVRGADPYGLADAAALFEWVLARDGTFVERLGTGPGGHLDLAGAVLLHLPGRFDWSPPQPGSAPEVARLWLERRAPVQVLQLTE